MGSHRSAGCDEYERLSRRGFLALSGGAAAAALLPAWLPRVALATDACTSRDVLVTIFLRGAADGLSLCVPHGDPAYYAARPTIAVPRPDSGAPLRAIDLDGFFGLPPALAPLMEAYDAGELLIAHACGTHDPSRSHFDGQRFIEVGRPSDTSLFTGWIGRHLQRVSPISPNAVLRGVGLNYGLARALVGGPQTLPIADLDAFGLDGAPGTREWRSDAIIDMYAAFGGPMRATAETTAATTALLDAIDFAGYTPGGGAVYGTDDFGRALKSSAALIRADVGVEAIAVDLEGWDTHVNQGTLDGALAALMASLAANVAAFRTDVITHAGRNVTIAIISEFGRQLAENGGFGCDHGHGNAMMLLGRHIQGGRVLATWPGLAPEQLFEGRDLEVTLDFRDILAEIVALRLDNPDLPFVFPGYTPTFRGVTRGCASGDMNCDGVTDNGDIDAFTLALTDRSGYAAAHPGCDPLNGDLNGDGLLDNADIDGFAQCLLGNP